MNENYEETSKKPEITEFNEELAETVKNEWLAIGLQTRKRKLGQKKTEKLINAAYKQAELAAPRTIIVDSPRIGIAAAHYVSMMYTAEDCKDFLDKGNFTFDDFVNEIKRVSAERDEEIDQSELRNALWNQLYKCGYGAHDAGWLSFYDYFLREGLEEVELLKPLMELSKYVGWWWPFTEIAIVSPPPATIHRDDEHRLHHESEAALTYPDGFGVWAWHGVRVEEHIITKPHELTAEMALNEENQEIRRIILERYGYDRLLEDLEAETVHEDRFGRLVETNKLGDYLDGEDPSARFVLVKDPSTARRYALRVPPNCETAKEGVAWTGHIEVEEYDVVAES